MRIAIDYDSTWTADPLFWQNFVLAAKASGHDVRMVTARNEQHDRTPALFAIEREMKVYWTRGVAKGWWMSHFAEGWIPEIVIDDKPGSWSNNSSMPPDALAEWRSTRDEGVNYGRA